MKLASGAVCFDLESSSADMGFGISLGSFWGWRGFSISMMGIAMTLGSGFGFDLIYGYGASD